MKDLSDKTVLFISPKFFNYEVEIQDALKAFGAQVTWFDERPSNTFITKVLLRLDKKFLRRKIERYYEDVLRLLVERGGDFDYILIISPESISKTQIEKFKEKFSHAKIILYMWDSFKNKGALEILPLVDTALTFDSEDAKKYNLKHRPLFYIEAYKNKKKEELYDLLFVGTAHSDRYNFIKKVVQHIPDYFKLKLFFFLGSKKLFWTKKVFDPDFRTVKFKDVCFASLSHQKNADLVHSSKIILDINHPEQIGLTMRTLETLGAQKKLITTNRDIINYDFYNPTNILVIDRKNPVIPEVFLTSSFNPSSLHLLEKYSIKGWIRELFDIEP